jgi:CRP/FNR family transcriptional regulator, cyclic AMP receptor protein
VGVVTTRGPLFEGSSEQEAARLLERARRRSFDAGEVVFHAGDPADTLHLIQRGRFAARVTTEFGDTATLNVMGPGDFFGELALLSPRAPRSATVIALEKAETLSVHELDFGRLRTERPETADVLIAILAASVRRLSMHLAEALYVPADTRVRRRLLEMAEVYGGDDEVTVPLTQEELASLAGTSRATVNRVLREEEGFGTLKLARGRTRVTDAAGLRRRAFP